MSQRTARRRRLQAVQGYSHLPPLRRPYYSKRDSDAAERRLKAAVEKHKLIQQRKGQKKH